MKKSKLQPLPKILQKTLKEFPKQVKRNRTEKLKKIRFAEKIFGKLARHVHRQVQGKK